MDTFSQVANSKKGIQKEAWKKLACQGFDIFREMEAWCEKKPFSLSEKRCLFVDSIPERPLELIPLKEALEHFASLLLPSLEEEKNGFSLLNCALFEEGYFIYLPEGSSQLNLSFIYSLQNQRDYPLFFPRIQIYLGKRAKLDLHLSENEKEESSLLSASHFEITLEEGAVLNIFSLSNLSALSTHVKNWRVKAGAKSKFSLTSLSRGAKLERVESKVDLKGENSNVDFTQGFLMDAERRASLAIEASHLVKNTSSQQTVKSVLKGSSDFQFEGKIKVAPYSDGTNAYQISRALLLSDRARARALPTLEILADEVKATHGATIGQINDEELFYLKARGLSEVEGIHLLTLGFFKEIFELFPPKKRALAYDFAKYI